MNIGRRGFLGLIGGAIAGAVLPRVPQVAPISVVPEKIAIPSARLFFSPATPSVFYGTIHPFFLRDLLGVGPMPRAIRAPKNRRRNKARQAYLLSVAKWNESTSIEDVLEEAA